MRFFLDHDVPGEVARVLRHEGYEVPELREVLAVRLPMLKCSITPVRRRSRHVECGHLLALLKRAGDSGLIRNVNFA